MNSDLIITCNCVSDWSRIDRKDWEIKRMPKYNVMVTRTRTVISSFEIEEVSAKDEEGAEEKIREKIEKAANEGKLMEKFDFEDSDDTDKFEYEVTEA